MTRAGSGPIGRSVMPERFNSTSGPKVDGVVTFTDEEMDATPKVYSEAYVKRLHDRIDKLESGKATLIRENKRLADMVARLSPGYRP